MLGGSHLYICKMATVYIILAAIVIVPTLQQEDRDCQFPWIFRDVSYSTCSNPDYSKGPWCSVQTDDMNNHVTGQYKYCKDCDPKCKNGGTCNVYLTCECTPGWTGDSCEIEVPNETTCDTAVCDPPCAVGVCTAHNTCKYRSDSEESICKNDGAATICLELNQDSCKSPTFRTLCKHLCSFDSCTRNCKNGICSSSFTCECNAGFQGPNCDAADGAATICLELNQDSCKSPTIRTQCKHVCSSDSCTRNCKNGICSSSFTCDCNEGFQGPNCDAADGAATICLEVNQDSCKYPTIRNQCKSLCSSDSCTRNCKNGTCSSTFTCDCNAGFQGPNCDAAGGFDEICKRMNLEDCKEKSIREQCQSMCSARESCASRCVNGNCTENFTCECHEGFLGHNCDQRKPDKYWKIIRKACIRGRIPPWYHNTSIEDCKKKCEEYERSGVFCKSFTYRNGHCVLHSIGSTSNAFTQPCYDKVESDLYEYM